MTILKPVGIGLALGLTFSIISVLCAILVYLFPEGMFSLANSIFHGIEFSQASSFSFVNVLIGVIALFIIGFVGGWIFGRINNWIN